jgi:hypothetical protein
LDPTYFLDAASLNKSEIKTIRGRKECPEAVRNQSLAANSSEEEILDASRKD